MYKVTIAGSVDHVNNWLELTCVVGQMKLVTAGTTSEDCVEKMVSCLSELGVTCYFRTFYDGPGTINDSWYYELENGRILN